MKNIFLGILTILYSASLFAQIPTKYFEKRENFGYISYYYKILANDSTYTTIGAYVSPDHTFQADFASHLNKHADTSSFHLFLPFDTTQHSFLLVDMVPTADGYVMCGWEKVFFTTQYGNQSTYEGRGMLYFLNNSLDSQKVVMVGNVGEHLRLNRVLATADGGYISVGQKWYPDSIAWELYAVKLSPQGNIEWDTMYVNYQFSNHFYGILPSQNGGYYLTGKVKDNFDPDFQVTNNADALLMEIDSIGNIVRDTTYSFSDDSDGAGEFVQTQDGGFIIFVSTYKVGASNHKYTIIKVDTNFNIIKSNINQEVFGTTGGGGSPKLLLANGDVIFTGRYSPDILDEINHPAMAKVDGNGVKKWMRYYVNTNPNNWNCYIGSIVPAYDGGYVGVGRCGGVTYLVKTNCMGLLTEPYAHFNYAANEANTAQFTNMSQYVYPDSIDGGYFIWDFGDSSQSQQTHPLHTYAQAGEYNVTLTAVVCNDTSISTVKVQVPWATGVLPPISPTNSLPIGTSRVKVYDVTGRLLLQTPYNAVQNNNLALPNGIYIQVVENKEGKVLSREKVVVVK